MKRSAVGAAMTGVIVALALQGCASLQRVQPSAIAQMPSQKKAADNFSISGRFAAKSGEQQGSGGFRYEQIGATRTLDIFTPAATQIARIEANGTSAKVTLSDGGVREAATLSALLRQFIDIPIADAQFSAWLQGVPSVEQTEISRGNDGQIASFRESGWTILVNSRFDGNAGFVRTMRWNFDAGSAAQAAEVRWVFDEFSAK